VTEKADDGRIRIQANKTGWHLCADLAAGNGHDITIASLFVKERAGVFNLDFAHDRTQDHADEGVRLMNKDHIPCRFFQLFFVVDPHSYPGC